VKFSEKLRELKDKAGLSEAKLAELSGVTRATIHDYGLGRRKPSFAAVVKLARALNVTCEAFAECDDIAPSTKNSSAAPKKARRPRRSS
jgi:transcriptional regulator with XRE-family HTH domain